MATSRQDSPHALPLGPVALVGSVVVAGSLVGIMEGWIYPGAEGPRAPLFTYWAVMLGVLFLVLVGALRLLAAEAAPKSILLAVAFTLLPAALVVQDAASLFGQGSAPWNAYWYRQVFGTSFLTVHYAGLPGWYYGAILLSLVLILVMVVPARSGRPVDA